MIATRKDILFFIELVALSAIAVVYALTQIPSPFEQQKLKWDQERVIDLGKLKNAIDQYYYTNAKLPEALAVVTSEGYSPDMLRKTDPQTDQPYTYRVTSPISYEICAVFVTANKDLASVDDYNYEKYDYQTYRNQFKHPQGTFCFSQKVQDQRYESNYPTPTRISSPTILPLPTNTPNPTSSL
ncbi:MAG: hypothetical protein AAB553_06185 [Patescibacteria group bacterium]